MPNIKKNKGRSFLVIAADIWNELAIILRKVPSKSFQIEFFERKKKKTLLFTFFIIYR
jgi:hypothetical protein